MTPFDQGWCDAQSGLHLWDNPFNSKWSPDLHEAWMRGWWGWVNENDNH